MINVTITTNDDLRCESWPRRMVVTPEVGHRIQSASGRHAVIASITHTGDTHQSNDQWNPYQPCLLVEITPIGYHRVRE